MTKESLLKNLERMYQGQYTGFSISDLTNKIAWMWKWKKIDYEQLILMTTLARAIMEDISPEEEELLTKYFEKD